jgi:hypothetical protein
VVPANDGETSTAPETARENFPAVESEAGSSAPPETLSPVAASENTPSPAVEEPVRAPKPSHPARPERRQEPPRSKPWVKPADFRPADTSAIHQAVVHATEIAESLRELTDRIDEILELVEVAERQKLADERELDNLRRALRRIQPPRQASAHESHRGHSRGEHRPRHEGSPSRPEPGHAHEPAHEPHSELPPEPEETHEPEAFDEESQPEV